MQLRAYTYKRKVKTFGPGPWWIGMELEVEAPSYAAVEQGLGMRAAPSSIYAKRDGSLGSTGWELVTQPISPELWLKPSGRVFSERSKTPGRIVANISWKVLHMISGLRAMGYQSYNGGRCGLHLHVTRTAFDGLPEVGSHDILTGHAYWFRRLIHGDLFAALSQRRDFYFCRRDPAAVAKSSYTQPSRYQAVNVTRHTIEVRIFRGNVREDRIRAAVELVIAAVEYTRTITTEFGAGLTVEGVAVLLDEGFRNYIRTNADKYKFAAARINEIGDVGEEASDNDTNC